MICVMATSKPPGAPGHADDRQWMVWLCSAGIVLASIGIAVPLVAGGVIPMPNSSGEPSAWRTGSGFVVSAVGLAIAGAGIYRMTRTGAYNSRNRAALTSFSREQRRQAVRLVRRGGPADQDTTVVTAAVAASLARQRQAVLLYAGIALNGIGTALRITNPGWITLMALGVIILMAVAIPLVRRDARLGQRWLDTYPQPVATEVAGS